MRVNYAQLSTSTVTSSARIKILSTGSLIVLGVGLGLTVAFLISRGQWFYAFALAVLAPLVILCVTRPFVGVILWLVLMPFSSVLPNPEVMYWAFHRIMIPGILILAILSRLLRISKHPPVRLGAPELAMGILVVLIPSLILVFQTDTRLPLIRYADRVLIPCGMYLIVRLAAPRGQELRLLQWTALFIAISQSSIGLVSWFAPQLLPSAWQYLQGVRTSGSLLNPNVYTVMLVFCITVLFQAAMNHKPGLVRVVFLFTCGLSAICVFLSLERAAWLGGMFAAIGLLVLYPKPMLRLIPVGVIVMIGLGGGLLSTHFAAAGERMSHQQPIYDRIVVADAMLQMIQLKPVVGWGYETLNLNIQPFYQRVGDAFITGFVTSHNTYLTILTELGLVGFLLYLFPAVWWLVLTARAWRRIPNEGVGGRSFLAALWLAMLNSFIVSNFMDMRYFPIGLALWWVTLGLIANLVYPYSNSDDRLASSWARHNVSAISISSTRSSRGYWV